MNDEMVEWWKGQWKPSRTGAWILVINGASSAGKSTLAKAVQDLTKEPSLIVSLDQFRDSIPDRWRGLNSKPSQPGAQGLNIVPKTLDGELVTDIQFGRYGERVLEGMRCCVATLARCQLNVIVDDLVLDEASSSQYDTGYEYGPLFGMCVFKVGLHCSIDELNRREQLREGRFPGTARSTLEKVHKHMQYDLELDSTNTQPKELAAQVLTPLLEKNYWFCFSRPFG